MKKVFFRSVSPPTGGLPSLTLKNSNLNRGLRKRDLKFFCCSTKSVLSFLQKRLLALRYYEQSNL